MPVDPNSLPHDPEILKQMLVDLTSQPDKTQRLLRQLMEAKRELDWRSLLSQPLPPSVESMLTQASSATVCADRLAAAFLLCDSLAPQLAPLLCFLHSSTMRDPRRLG